MAYWTQYWKNETVENEDALIAAGYASGNIDHAAGELFRERGVSPGDVVYMVSRIKGKFHLLGKMTVGEIVDQSTANVRFGRRMWEATDHLIASPPLTRFRLNVEVPASMLTQVEFVNVKGTLPLKFDKKSQIDQQTLRGVREITAATAGLFNSLL